MFSTKSSACDEKGMFSSRISKYLLVAYITMKGRGFSSAFELDEEIANPTWTIVIVRILRQEDSKRRLRGNLIGNLILYILILYTLYYIT